MDEDNGDRVLPLERAQATEELAHVCRRVFISSVEPDHGVENQEARLDLGEGRGKSLLVLVGVSVVIRRRGF